MSSIKIADKTWTLKILLASWKKICCQSKENYPVHGNVVSLRESSFRVAPLYPTYGPDYAILNKLF